MPDARKINTEPKPRLGGLGFFASSALLLLFFVTKNDTVAAIICGGSILVAGGVLDDTYDIPPLLKLLIQSSAALVSIAIVGIPSELSLFGLVKIPLFGLFGFVISFFRIVFTVNAVNFSDGLDGLASGLSFVAFISLYVYGIANINTIPALGALILAFSVLGFIPYNKYHAKIFMGDSGSQFLGLSIALLSLECAPRGSFTVETSLFLAIPTLDTFFSVVRRLLKGKSPFSADKGHLHHILISFGIEHPTAVKILVSLSALVASVTLVFIINA